MVGLRAATPDDADAIAAVHVASWRVGYRGLLPDAVLDGLSTADRARRWRERLTAPSPRSRTALVVDGDAVLGFAFTGPARDVTDDPAAGQLYAFYLDPGSWGRGHGARLHAGALANLDADGFVHAHLWVLDGNTRARRFYGRQGWVETGETKTEWDVGERRLRRDVR